MQAGIKQNNYYICHSIILRTTRIFLGLIHQEYQLISPLSTKYGHERFKIQPAFTNISNEFDKIRPLDHHSVATLYTIIVQLSKLNLLISG